ncbi:transposase [Streptomyces sp. TLI_55]|uniref:transposase n=1 Tax=Streptomyces sp. TLI_55 TaxID=1938861 RepID=UPI000BE45BD4|nr:transposase [Streptomyces sp. TLI_55]
MASRSRAGDLGPPPCPPHPAVLDAPALSQQCARAAGQSRRISSGTLRRLPALAARVCLLRPLAGHGTGHRAARPAAGSRPRRRRPQHRAERGRRGLAVGKADAATVTFASRGYDAAKRINGRKRHLLTDTLGLLLDVAVTPASTTDRDAARILLPAAIRRLPRLSLIWADGGYRGHLQDWAAQHLKLVLDVVRRSDDVSGFAVLPRR